MNATLTKQINAAGYPTTYNSFTPTGQMLDNMSVHDWIASYVPGGLASKLLDDPNTQLLAW